jgi:hypothetical protein
MDDGATPLKNARWEAFCQHYAGGCFGNASKAYSEAGYAVKTPGALQADASRLLRNGIVFDRVTFLRKQRMKELAIDQTRIMEMRLKVIYGQDSSDSDRLRALDSIEKAMGWHQPEKVEHSMAEGAVIRFVNESKGGESDEG